MRLRILALLLTAASVTLVQAQNNNGDTPQNLPNLDDTSSASKSGSSSSRTTASSASKTDSSSNSGSSSKTSAPATTNAPITGAPSLSTRTKSYDGITGAPTLSGVFSYPPPSVPPTAQAPFMQKSTLPQGTVFIAVGAALGFLFSLFLLWRCMVAWSLHRSVKRANNPYYTKLQKKFKLGNESHDAMLAGPNAPFYKQRPGSSMSLDPLNGSATNKTPYKGNQNTGSLFFSPTAGTGMHSSHGNRHSTGGYLPAGYYAAGASAVGGGLAGDGRPISMADFTGNTPQAQGYQRTGPSPPGTPSISSHPTEPYGRLNTSAGLSTHSLGNRSEGRAPSAYLDDLFDYPPVPTNNTTEQRRY